MFRERLVLTWGAVGAMGGPSRGEGTHGLTQVEEEGRL